LVDAWSIRDPAARALLVRTIIQVCRDREVEPVHYRAVVAAVGDSVAMIRTG